MTRYRGIRQVRSRYQDTSSQGGEKRTYFRSSVNARHQSRILLISYFILSQYDFMSTDLAISIVVRQ
jgi:hypothetical protein